MIYAIVREKDNQVVVSNLTKEQAESKIIFYDTEEDPHSVKCVTEDDRF